MQLGKQAFNEAQQLQDFQAAAGKFSKGVEQKPDAKLTYILWSETLLLIGDLPVDSRTRLACYQGAVEKCRKAAELAPNDWDSYNKWAVILSTKLPEYAVNDQARFALYEEAAALYAKAAERARFSSEVGPVCANWASVLVQAAHVSSNREVKVTLLRQSLEKFGRAGEGATQRGRHVCHVGECVDRPGQVEPHAQRSPRRRGETQYESGSSTR